MGIKGQIERLVEIKKDERASRLWSVCKEILEETIAHNKRIMGQMEDYDLHDETHSEKVLEIMGGLLGDKIEGLTFYELALLYLSAYLHDSAMALPEWEHKALRAVEGTEELHDNTLGFFIGNDFKPVHKFSEALEVVTENKNEILKGEKLDAYIFAQESEEQLLHSLANLICEYEEFRNGYIEDLEKYRGSFAEYHNMSKMIRSEYIRQTHHIRAGRNVSALKRRFSQALGERYAKYFTEDLEKVCQCHGEEVEELFGLEVERKDWMGEVSNIQFVAMLLRLGDVVHFSADRAPLSLFAEKQITDEASYMHWKAKFQEVSYEIYQENDNVCIKYTAYCKTPDTYYFIQDYLDWVDAEIGNYHNLRNRWNRLKLGKPSAYSLLLKMAVDRKELDYDKDCFMPDTGLKFVLSQAKILDLLMGVQLYKDKSLCLRELYQNALDASKCMMAYNKMKHAVEELEIEFGVGREMVQGVERKYVYCLDHGTGMDGYIIKNCLLHIGNSYYKSREFARKNTDWAYHVVPTSQFGIGILSCYMLADKIGISTISYETKDSYISFILEGVNEHFYYTKTSQLERERLGGHGTMVKLYLKPEFEEPINAVYFPKMPLAMMNSSDEVMELVCDKETLEGNLFYILSKHIGIEHPGIKVFIQDEARKKRRIYQSVSIYDRREYQEISDLDEERMRNPGTSKDRDVNPYKEYAAKRDRIENYRLHVTNNNFEIYSCFSLPKKGIGEVSGAVFQFCEFLGRGNGSIYVDGILAGMVGDVEGYKILFLQEEILHESILNFYGADRPVLSVDRNSILKMPDIRKTFPQLQRCFVEELHRILWKHLERENIEPGDPELQLIWNALSFKFPSLTANLLYLFRNSKYAQAELEGFVLKSLFAGKGLLIDHADFTQYHEATRQILLGSIIGADNLTVSGFQVSMSGERYICFPGYELPGRILGVLDASLRSVAIKADKWEGQFGEYDLVNRLWPIVPPKLFMNIKGGRAFKVGVERCIEFLTLQNSLSDIATLDPVSIHPDRGIGYPRRSCPNHFSIGKIVPILSDFSLLGLSVGEKDGNGRATSPALFAYIAPRKLSGLEEKELAELEAGDPEYVKGVREGWSILFLGAMKKYIIAPGVISRRQIAERIPDSFKAIDPGIQYLFTDGSPVF